MRTAYERESASTAWFVGIITALALLAIGYLVFAANETPDSYRHLGSGLAVITDPETGCEYLTRSTQLTPRLDASGAPICTPQKPITH